MVLWDFIEQYLFPLFGEITPCALEKVQNIFWITLGVIIVHFSYSFRIRRCFA